MALTSTGCASLNGRLVDASVKKAIATSPSIPARMPADCHEKEAHAPLAVGTEARSALKRERQALDRANSRVVRCAEHAEKHFVVKPAS